MDYPIKRKPPGILITNPNQLQNVLSPLTESRPSVCPILPIWITSWITEIARHAAMGYVFFVHSRNGAGIRKPKIRQMRARNCSETWTGFTNDGYKFTFKHEDLNNSCRLLWKIRRQMKPDSNLKTHDGWRGSEQTKKPLDDTWLPKHRQYDAIELDFPPKAEQCVPFSPVNYFKTHAETTIKATYSIQS